MQRWGASGGKYAIPPEAVAERDAALAAAAYDGSDRLIQLCDALAVVDGPVDRAARMEDVRRRYGDYPQDKWDKNFELRGWFERWAGADIYEIVR